MFLVPYHSLRNECSIAGLGLAYAPLPRLRVRSLPLGPSGSCVYYGRCTLIGKVVGTHHMVMLLRRVQCPASTGYVPSHTKDLVASILLPQNNAAIVCFPGPSVLHECFAGEVALPLLVLFALLL